MGFKCGIVGLPNVGKSTLFNAITAAGAEAANYPFCTIEPNVGVVAVPDERMQQLADIVKTTKLLPTTIEFVDIAGLVKGAAQGEGLGNQFLGHIREVDAIVHVVRCFEDENIVHVDGSINPQRDIEVIEAELIFKDLDTIEKRISRTEKLAKTGDRKLRAELDALIALRDLLLTGKPARAYRPDTPEAEEVVATLFLLTAKPVLYAANVAESEVTTGNAQVEVVRRIAAEEGARVIVISAAVEAEIGELDPAERSEFLEGLGLDESGLDQMVRAGYDLLGLITYFTAGKQEVHAWTITRGTKAPQAAAVIHTDFEKGFIRAEVMKAADMIRLGSEAAVKEAGLLAVEGRDYIVHDGDVMHFRFNV